MERLFAKFANATARITGSPVAFLVCVAAVLLWAASGPVFHFSETWQLVINTGTTIVTFLMVFLIQNTQNRDGAALQTKLDELIRSSQAENRFMGIEKMTDSELEELHQHCEKEARRSQALLDRARSERHARSKSALAQTVTGEAPPAKTRRRKAAGKAAR
jgi:low affinity Fe/Cu permease